MEKADKVTVVIVGMTREQALTFAEWYEGEGEQDQEVWFEDRGVRIPITDVQRRGGYMEDGGEHITIHVK